MSPLPASPAASSSAKPSTNGAHANGASGTPQPAAGAAASLLNLTDTFACRHIGPTEADLKTMLGTLGYSSLDQLADATVPGAIRMHKALNLAGLPAEGLGETAALTRLRTIAQKNKVNRSFIGMGYYDTITPPVILRNILENPGWYTQYTPYQAEISQGRLETLLNFQTMVSDLTALPLAGASLLDEATAAAEAMAMCYSVAGGHEGTKQVFYVSDDCHPQTIGVCRTRAESQGIQLRVGPADKVDFSKNDVCGVLVQYPTTDGRIVSYDDLAKRTHEAGALLVAATDLLALTLIKPPGEWGGGGVGGADIAVGSAQRFGVPMGGGGPHAAFIATKNEYARRLPGRIIGVSKDAQGNVAFRMAIQTREQHIKRERATSNICTAQALLAIIAGMYAVYHGPEGLKKTAQRVHTITAALYHVLIALDCTPANKQDFNFFDTIRIKPNPALGSVTIIVNRLRERQINARDYGDGTLGFSCDETTTLSDLEVIASVFNFGGNGKAEWSNVFNSVRENGLGTQLDPSAARTTPFLTHPVFNSHHSESEMLRYIFKLQGRDLSLTHSMIPLGSCTMKLNATSEMLPVTWAEFGRIHPYAPADQLAGYHELFRDLETWLAEITGFAATSLQPNAGSQGEYAGLLAIRAYHQSRGQGHRNICLIPDSAHGTNPASAVVAGLHVVAVANKPNGDIDLDDLKAKAAENKDNLAALMVTYPSTYGVFEEHIKDVCKIVHDNGGQVYMDGANMNAQVGLCRPGEIGADVCHLNLHKTFCIPHGGGGPGMGPICVAKHLAPFLPGNPMNGKNAVSAAPYGSPSILTIPWMYIAMMGADGLKKATQAAILNANYMSKKLEGHYPVLFKGPNGRCAHEFIIDCRQFEKSAGIKSEDIAKRLMDYGFHAPTMSFPVPGTLMIEPTESEPKGELDRFCEALIAIRAEIGAIESGQMDRADNPLKNAPHTAFVVTANEWKHPYTREQAAWPLPWLRGHKFWPSVGRIDNPYGDRNLVCVCPPMSTYS